MHGIEWGCNGKLRAAWSEKGGLHKMRGTFSGVPIITLIRIIAVWDPHTKDYSITESP